MLKFVRDTNISWYSFRYAIYVIFSWQTLIFEHTKKFCEFHSFKQAQYYPANRSLKSSRILVDVIWGVPIIVKFVLEAYTDNLLTN